MTSSNLVPVSTTPEPHSSNGHNYDALARGYIEALKRGETPERPNVGKWASLCDTLDYGKGDASAIEKTLKAAGIHKRYPGLKELLNPSVANPGASKGHSEKTAPQIEDVKNNENSCPPLPEGIALDPSLARGACPLRDIYIEYSKIVSPEGYSEFHDACFWSMLSTVAARRIFASLKKPIYTPLYILLAARSSLFAKSETTGAMKNVMREAGLHWLLGTNRLTPQRLLQEMSGIIPQDYNVLPCDRQERIKQRLAFAGQRGWVVDEFGKFIKGMLRPNSYMSEFADILLTFDNCEPEFESATIGRGSEPIDRPYLSILGCMTPASIQDNARAGSEFWRDGFWARTALVAPPPNDYNDAPFGLDYEQVPPILSSELQKWHVRLGVPEIDVVEQVDKKGEPTGKYKSVVINEPQETRIIASTIHQAWARYRSALKSMISKFPNEDLDASYARLPTKAVRIATLAASLQGCSQIEMRHWALAQQVVESWRVQLHRFYEQVNTQPKQSGPTLEEKVIETVQKLHEKGSETVSARDVATAMRKDSKDIVPYMRSLARDGLFEEIPGRQNPRYKIRGHQNTTEEIIEEEEEI